MVGSVSMAATSHKRHENDTHSVLLVSLGLFHVCLLCLFVAIPDDPGPEAPVAVQNLSPLPLASDPVPVAVKAVRITIRPVYPKPPVRDVAAIEVGRRRRDADIRVGRMALLTSCRHDRWLHQRWPVRPQAGAVLACSLLCGEISVYATDIGRVGGGLRHALFNQREINKLLAGNHVAEQPPKPIPLADVARKPEWTALDKAAVGLGCLTVSRLIALRGVDANVPDALGAAVDPHVNRVAVDHPHKCGRFPHQSFKTGNSYSWRCSRW